MSHDVRKLIAIGKGPDLMTAIEMEMKGGKGYATFNGITVTRVGRIFLDQ